MVVVVDIYQRKNAILKRGRGRGGVMHSAANSIDFKGLFIGTIRSKYFATIVEDTLIDDAACVILVFGKTL